MYDAHVHLDFMSNGEQVAAEAKAAGAQLFASTVTPAGFQAARQRFGGFSNVQVGLGLHPWWVGSPHDVDEFLSLLGETEFVSEVGLDFGPRHAATKTLQLYAFERIAAACAQVGGKTLSIHSVRAPREALDILEAAGTLESCTCIFHWFTGPSDQLKRAVKAGCLFSAGTRMLATGKGREYVKAIPARQLLTETDAPPKQGMAYSFAKLSAQLQETEEAIAQIKGSQALELINRPAFL